MSDTLSPLRRQNPRWEPEVAAGRWNVNLCCCRFCQSFPLQIGRSGARGRATRPQEGPHLTAASKEPRHEAQANFSSDNAPRAGRRRQPGQNRESEQSRRIGLPLKICQPSGKAPLNISAHDEPVFLVPPW